MQTAGNYQKFSCGTRNEFLDISVRWTLKETKKCKSEIFPVTCCIRRLNFIESQHSTNVFSVYNWLACLSEVLALGFAKQPYSVSVMTL